MKKNMKVGISKRKAEEIAGKLRRQGYRVRVIKTDKSPNLFEPFRDGHRIAKMHSLKEKRKR